MRNLLSPITKSRQELKKVSTITACAMFGALSVVLSYYSIRVTPNLKVGLGALPNELVDYLFGPFVGPLFGGAMDIIKYMLQPDGGFMPGFTFNAMLAAFIYGMFLYQKPLSLKRMLIAKLIVVVLCNIILGTWWLSMINGRAWIALLPARAIKNLIQWPVDSILFFRYFLEKVSRDNHHSDHVNRRGRQNRFLRQFFLPHCQLLSIDGSFTNFYQRCSLWESLTSVYGCRSPYIYWIFRDFYGIVKP